MNLGRLVNERPVRWQVEGSTLRQDLRPDWMRLDIAGVLPAESSAGGHLLELKENRACLAGEYREDVQDPQ